MTEAGTYPRAMLTPCNSPATHAYTWPWHVQRTKRSKPKVVRTATRYACQHHLYQVFNTCMLITDTKADDLEDYLQVIELHGGDVNPADHEHGWPLCTNQNHKLTEDPRCTEAS